MTNGQNRRGPRKVYFQGVEILRPAVPPKTPLSRLRRAAKIAVSSPRRSKPERALSVFINCPFDVEYRPLLRAMCFTIICCGLRPCCALDFSDSSESRLHRILDLILDCAMSIHDISRIQLDVDSGLPRFNMPLELGADLGLKLRGPSRQRDRRLLILEAERRRYDITMSDISGQDIEPHHDNEQEIIARVRDWLNAGRSGEEPLPGAASIQNGYAAYLTVVPQIIATAALDPLDRLSHSDFLWTIYTALAEMAREPGITEKFAP